MTCAPEHVDRFNLNLVVNSTRFVYAPTDDFDTAKQFLQSHPDAKMQGGLIQTTQLSDHPDSLDQTLVIRGASTAYEIPFETWEDCGTHLTVRVSESSVEELSRAILDFPHSAIQINDRKKGGRGMREIKLSQNDTDARTVTIRHSNPVLAAITGQARGRR